MRWLLLLCAGCGVVGGNNTSSTTGGTTGGGTTGTTNDPFVKHNLDALNAYRAANNAPPLALSDALNQFAVTGSMQLAAGGMPHGHFQQAISDGTIWQSGFCSGAGENQAPNWPINNDENATIDSVLQMMMNEGPGGGHHDNIVNPKFALVGIGLVVQGGGLYLTNDFSNACP
jgi:uncharacterized protein YkwD